MPIQYVGGVAGGRAGATSTTTQSLSGTLTGGIDTSPKPHDLVIVTCVVGSQARNPAQAITTPAGYTALGQLNPTAATYDTSLNVSYKRMAGPADTSITIPSTGNTADAQSWTVQVFRGVNWTSPLDVAAVSATGTGTSRPDPAAITPVTAGAWVVVCSGGAAATASALTYAGLSNVLTHADADTNDSVVASGHYSGWTTGAYDPAVSSTGDATSTSSWAAYTIALRPNPATSALTDNFDDNSIDTSKWATEIPAGSSVTESGGAINIDPGESSFANLWSKVYHCLTGSEVVVKVTPPQGVSGAASGFETGLLFTDDSGGAFDVTWISDGTSTGALRSRHNGVTFGTPATYNASTHAWWRVRESGGTVYVDFAPSSASNPPASGDWVNFSSVTTATMGFPVSSVAVALRSVRGASLPTPSAPAKFDGFNAAANSTGPATIVGSLAATEVGADTATGTGAVTVAGALVAAETGADAAAIGGAVSVAGSLATGETGADGLAAAGLVAVAGAAAAAESGSDVCAATASAGLLGLSTVIEPFDSTIDTAKWDIYTSAGAASIVDGALDLNITGTVVGNHAAIRTVQNYALAESSVYLQVVRPLQTNAAVDGAWVTMRIHTAASDGVWVEWFINNLGVLVARIGQNYADFDTNTVLDWDPVNHKWLRIRMSGGTIYWETAPDNAGAPGSWTIQRTASTLPADFTETKLILWAHYATDGAGSVVQSARLDGLNTVGSVPAITGTLVASETGVDALAGTAAVSVAGALGAAETGADTAASSGAVVIAGSLALAEAGADTAAAGGSVYVSGSLAPTEAGVDGLAAVGLVTIAGTLAAAEAADTLAASATVSTVGALAAAESGADTISSFGVIPVQGTAPLAETGPDAFAASGALGNMQISALTENFDATLDTAKWDGGTFAVTGGVLDLSPAQVSGATSWIQSKGVYSLEGSECYVQVVRPLLTGGSTESAFQFFEIGDAAGNGNAVQWIISSLGNLVARVSVVGTPDGDVTVGAWDSANHKWLKISMAGGTVTWSTAPDSGYGTPGAWTVRRTATSLPSAFTSVKPVLWAIWYGPDATTQTGRFDGLNTAGTVGTIAGTLAAAEPAVSDGFAGSGAVKVAGALTVSEAATDAFGATGVVKLTGAFTAAEQTPDTLAAAGTVAISGSLGTAEQGVDTATGSAQLAVTGALTAAEQGADTLASTGITGVTGTLAAVEGDDAFGGAGKVVVTGALTASEPAIQDSALAGGVVAIRGAIAAAEPADTFAGIGHPEQDGDLIALESGSDTASATGSVLVRGAAAAAEAAQPDTFAGLAQLNRIGALTAAEPGADGLAATGVVAIAGSCSAVEPVDTLAASGRVAIVGGFVINEAAAADTAAMTGGVLVRGALVVAEEPGLDTFETTGGKVFMSGVMTATEARDTFAGTGLVFTSGVMTATEVTADNAAVTGGVLVSGAITATEATQDDLAAMAGGVGITGVAACLETNDDIVFAEGYRSRGTNRSGFFFGSPF